MRVRTASDAVYTMIAWLPMVGVLVAGAWALLAGMAELEAISFGTEWFIGNDETTNLPTPLGPSDEELLLAALDTGDTAQMEAALAQVEERHARLLESRMSR